MDERTILIPVAGGKGGVGKSIFVANLAGALAEAGYDTVAVDLDLGCSNLHTLLGLPNSNPGIGNYIRNKSSNIEDYLMYAENRKLRFLAGDGRVPFMANISYAQKVKIIRDVQKISAKYVIIDLGAGTAFNTLDFFGISNYSIMITTFEYPAIMNVLVFLRNFILRQLYRMAKNNIYQREIMEELFDQPMHEDPLTIKEITERIDKIDSAMGETFRNVCARYRPRFVFNMGSHPDELKTVSYLDRVIKARLSIAPEYLGYILKDDNISDSIRKKQSLITEYPDGAAVREFRRIAESIVNEWDQRDVCSLDRLCNEAATRFEHTGGRHKAAAARAA